MDLKTVVPLLLPRAVQWVEEQERDILTSGRVLRPDEIVTARAVGVSQSEKIRIKSVSAIPAPQDSLLAEAAVQAGLRWASMAGMTLFYGIFIREGTYSRELLAHECRHVHQYEQRGSITNFLQEYLSQALAWGYEDSPLEKEAREIAREYELTLATGKGNT